MEVIADQTVALPPLNAALAEELVSTTRVSRLLAGYRNRPAADLPAILRTMIQVSQLICDIPEVAELDINPLFADETGVLALDARLRVAQAKTAGSQRLAIRPYPRELDDEITFDNRAIILRPVRPEDEPAHREFFRQLSPDDIRFRFFGLLRQPVDSELARFTQIDYEREMASIATWKDDPETLGVATDPDNITAEFAVVVRSDLKGKGLGSILLQKLISYCRDCGTSQIFGHLLPDDTRMQSLAKKFAFQLNKHSVEDVIEVRLSLTSH